ncbi:molybdopterin-dependent oxidoreductase [Aquisalimonas asiatica]|uniref:Oxidoreductase molybdopterin-binding domain-containing protein n=1 Tax=Aquisalimonas asiatica TaxID=406100 RepID=A0A1H8V769_9GAMM|nr:molybdopterin-dependent oxidoreductase [Aquisalimonas asiatica]SEP11229.1 hypothetical protein SAMN04488052_11055 [Aquisalimonas asiatica]
MRRWLGGLLMVLLPALAAAGSIEPSDASPTRDDTPVLTLIQNGERTTLSLADIESVGLYEADITHFEGLDGVFTGVKLQAFADAYGLNDARRIRFIAADDYTIFLEPQALTEREFLLVTRFEGEPVPRDMLGPLMLIVPEEEQAVLAGETAMTDWMWAITEIRAR